MLKRKVMHQNEYDSSVQSEMEETALRVELENEFKNKKQCTYQPYECTQLCIDGYKYCSKHILQDKNAPFKQCSFIYSSNGKRCNLPAPRSDKKDYGYCNEHALKATLARNRQNAKHPLPRTAEVLLHSLSHYVKKPRNRSNSSSTQHSDDGDRLTPDSELKSAKFLDPFVDFDANAVYNDKCNQVLDVCSESESDIEASTFSSVWQDAQADSSDDESIDSDNDDVLKHANVYTAEEVTLMTRDKLIRLQSLYIEQYRHLQYLLTKKRRKYLHALKREKETCCNIYNQIRDNPKEQRLYRKLKALNNYQKCHGTDAILSKRLRDLRMKSSEGNSKTQVHSKCIFTEGGVKCGERSLPLTKHCQKHILEDPHQVLFRACGKVTADVECPTSIAAIFEDATCPLHLEMPPLRSYCHVRKDSESDADETVDNHMNFQPPTHLTDNIKTEFIDYSIPPDIPKMESLPTMLFEESVQDVSEDVSNNSSTINLNFSKTLEVDKSLESDRNNKMELSTEIIDDKVDTKEDDLGINDGVDTKEDGLVVNEEDVSKNVVKGEENNAAVEETNNTIEEPMDITENDIVTENTVNKGINSVDEKSNFTEQIMATDHTSSMGDTAVDALLKAAEIINDQDNIKKMNVENPGVNNEESQIEEVKTCDVTDNDKNDEIVQDGTNN
ncbi:KAT8 regulatory NSL complex subunit 2 isoform X1 [Diorhabda carinulata]|uniref:KAT8 regulatory NSL complex subunit 2 isoform X1 n=1 Tax=Diorhabda carinulata TaxID=1163345 RepID=UPI0025A2D31A|nr:KAT8 regulatory NSL complex subunit 2 isoform X1 [Diorhabda carinulata]